MRCVVRLLALAAAALSVAPALAKLPELSAEAKAKLAEAAAKTAWSGNVDNYLLCKSQDRVAAKYRTDAAAAGKPVGAVPATPPCTDPGQFAYTPPQAVPKPLEAAGAHSPPATAASPPGTSAAAPKPLEAAGAHSPPATAASPPSTLAPDAVTNPAPKLK